MAWRESIELENIHHGNPLPMACRIGNMLFSSAISGADPETGKLPESLEEITANAFKNLRTVLEKGGATPGDVARLTVVIKDRGLRDALNKEWLAMFPDEHSRPARHTSEQPSLAGQLTLEVVAVIQGAKE